MSTVIEEPPTELVESTQEHGPDLSALTDKVPEAWRAPRALAGIVFVLGIIYLYYGNRPIWHTDVWGHISYGRYIWDTKTVPTTEPLLPLAKGVPFVDSAWLSQLMGYLIVTTPRLQHAGLQGLFGLGVTACCALLAFRAYKQTRSGWFAMSAIFGFVITGWFPLGVMRPQLAGVVCFVSLLMLLTSNKPRTSDWVVIPLLFTLWANLHGSFLMGLLLMACFCAGRAFDVIRRTRSVGAVLKDRRVRRLFLLTELSAAAVLINPYTIRLYVEVLQFSNNANLEDLTEWHPLTLRSDQGPLFAAMTLLLVLLYRSSPRRVRGWEVLSLVGLGLATLWSTRMIIWWAPVAAMLVALHGYAAWRRWRHKPFVASPAVTAGKWSLVTAGLVWISFMLSPLGIASIHGKHADPARSLSKFTPRFAVEVLTKNPPQGLVFNTYEWGDYLQWAGPRDLQLFVNSHAHLVPRDVWLAYMQVVDLRPGWEEVLDRYGINTVVLDTANRESLIKKLKEDEKWQYPPSERDGQVIFVRKKPINPGVAKPLSAEEKPVDAESNAEEH